jgi:hypothetical protein
MKADDYEKMGWVWDDELRRYRPRKTGWKNPGATKKPRDAQGRFLPSDLFGRAVCDKSGREAILH